MSNTWGPQDPREKQLAELVTNRNYQAREVTREEVSAACARLTHDDMRLLFNHRVVPEMYIPPDTAPVDERRRAIDRFTLHSNAVPLSFYLDAFLILRPDSE